MTPTTSSNGHPSLSLRKKMVFAAVLMGAGLVATEWALRSVTASTTPSNVNLLAQGRYFHSALQWVDRVERNGALVRTFRGRVFDPVKSTTWRIACLGGSTTDGYTLRYNETWPAMLEEMLRDRGLDVEVINAGRAGYTTAQSLISYALDVRFYDPDVVIIMQGFNDLGRSFPLPNEPPFERDYGSFQGPMHRVLRQAWVNRQDSLWTRWLLDSKLYRTVCTATAVNDMFYKALRNRSAVSPKPSIVDVGLSGFPSIASHRDNLDYLVRLCQDDERYVVLSTQGHLLRHARFADRAMNWTTRDGGRVSARSVARAMDACTQNIRAIGDAYDVTVVDAARALESNPDYFLDQIHLLPAGNRRMAELFTPVLLTLLLEQQDHPGGTTVFRTTSITGTSAENQPF